MTGYDLKIFDLTNRDDFNNNIEDDEQFGIIKYMEYPIFSEFKGWTVPVIIDHLYNIHFNNGFSFRNLGL